MLRFEGGEIKMTTAVAETQSCGEVYSVQDDAVVRCKTVHAVAVCGDVWCRCNAQGARVSRYAVALHNKSVSLTVS